MQTHFLVGRYFLFSAMLFLTSAVSPLSTYAKDDQPPKQTEDPQSKGGIVLPPKDRLGDVSPGAAEDTLKACLARIPEQAAVGQRMMAEMTCEREEVIRKTYQGIRGGL